MNIAACMERSRFVSTTPVKLDALIIGAGIAGLYQLHQLREQGLRVLAVDSAADVGGTWHWNRYPGARLDSQSYIYQYLFDEKIYKDWTWSERFPAQPEVEGWMHYVANRLNLRRDIIFSTTVTEARWDEDFKCWIVKTNQGDTYDTQYLIGCCGMLSAPLEKHFSGQKSFKGPIFHTARWPQEPINLVGKRVGIVGNGATGIQVIQTIAPEVGELKVFIRTPQYVIPMKNQKYGPVEVASYKDRFEELKQNLPRTFSGFEYDFIYHWGELTPEKRLEVLEENYADGSLKLWLASFVEIFFDEDISAEVSEFVRGKMKHRLKDPKLIEILVPSYGDYYFGTRRVPLETNYLEVYHRPNVKAISVKNNAITEIVPEGIKLSDSTVHELDVIILATGFDAISGALSRFDIYGREGCLLRDDWSRDIRTTMGMMVHGYPNLLITASPLAPSAGLCNMTACLQQQTEWISQLIQWMRNNGKTVLEPTAELEEEWVRHHDETASANLISRTNSWYISSNIEGKPRRVLPYTGGVGTYRQKCDEMAANGYPGITTE